MPLQTSPSHGSSTSTIQNNPGQPNNTLPTLPLHPLNAPQYSQSWEPWKSEGYPLFTQWMASSNDFAVVRRFTPMAERALLLLQDDLVQLEEKIGRMDEISRNQPKDHGTTGSFGQDKAEAGNPRIIAMREATEKLKAYYEFLELLSSVKNRPGAHEYQIRNVRNWLYNHYGAIVDKESAFIQKEGDLVAVVSKPKSLLRQGLEQVSYIRLLFSAKRRADRMPSETTSYFSDRGMDLWTSASIVLVGLGMLLGPMWVLELTSGGERRLTIITGFVVVFSVLLFSSTTSAARGFEVLAASAAYTAVLAVFLQINPHR